MKPDPAILRSIRDNWRRSLPGVTPASRVAQATVSIQACHSRLKGLPTARIASLPVADASTSSSESGVTRPNGTVAISFDTPAYAAAIARS